jgi:histidine phosphotransferase ChpT
MTDTIDIHVLELLASKICHDLISPVGAVANGVEFLEDMEIEGADDILGLITFSAKQGSAKLQAYRMAYGAGGADSSIKPEDVHKIFGAFIELDNKVKQDWDPYAPLGPEDRPAAFGKILMCVLILCVEALPKGGTITLKAGDNNTVVFEATGDDGHLKPDLVKALSESIPAEALSPRQMHAFTTRLLLKNYGYSLQTALNEAPLLRLSLTCPAA